MYSFSDQELENGEALLRIKRHQIELVARMGYDVSPDANLLVDLKGINGEVDEDLTVTAFLSAYYEIAKSRGIDLRQALNRVYEHRTIPERRLYAFYALPTGESTTLGVRSVSQFQIDVTAGKYQDALFISPVKLGAGARSTIDALTATNVKIFLDEELLFSPIKHVLYDKHRALDANETARFLMEARLTIDKLPSMKSDDPIARSLGFQVGSIIQIIRSNTFGETPVRNSVYYRVVVQAANKG